jgi:Fe-S-cluster-containing hydrogenase component 2
MGKIGNESNKKSKLKGNSRLVRPELLVVEGGGFVELVEDDSRFLPPPRISGKCTGCETCEAICSFSHFDLVSHALSAINVVNRDIDWIHRKAPRIFEVRVCRQCPGLSPCMSVCPRLEEGALYRDSESKAVLFDHEACIKCLACVEACPYDAITYSPRLNRLIKCDLCGGSPQCVEWCPPRVLRYTEK